MIKFVLTLSICLNLLLAATLFTLQSDQFMAIVDASRSVSESQQEVKLAIANFNSAVDKIEKITLRVDSNIVKIEKSIDSTLTSIGRIEDIVSY